MLESVYKNTVAYNFPYYLQSKRVNKYMGRDKGWREVKNWSWSCEQNTLTDKANFQNVFLLPFPSGSADGWGKSVFYNTMYWSNMYFWSLVSH